MSLGTWLLFLIAVAVGAPARYAVDVLLSTAVGRAVPWGILAVNVTGSFVLGVLTGLGLHHGFPSDAHLVLGTGFCGAYTTFSTFTFDTVRLAEAGRVGAAAVNLAVGTGGALAAAAAGLALTSW